MLASRVLLDQLKRTVIVTGGASGFGEATVRWMSERGANVVIADTNEEKGLRVSRSLCQDQGKAIFIHTDVTKLASWTNLVKKTIEEFGALDVLVNNAGASYINKPTLEVTEDEFNKCFDVNRKGVIVNVSSTAAMRPRGGLTCFADASKYAVNGATKSLAAEYATSGVRINAVCPVAGRTPLLKTFLGNNSEESFKATIPMGRLSEPEDVASAIGWLASDQAKFITGVCLEVDGGRCI